MSETPTRQDGGHDNRAEPSEQTTRSFRSDPIGGVTIQYDLDAGSYRRVLAGYWRARRAGYEDPIDLFIYNRCEHVKTTITVDGEPVDAQAEVEEWLATGAPDPQVEDPAGEIAAVRDALDALLETGDLETTSAEDALRDHRRALQDDVPTVGRGVAEAIDCLDEAIEEPADRAHLIGLARDVLNPPRDD